MNIIVLNKSNAINNNTFKYNFIGGNIDIKEGSTLSINQIIVPYSFVNISASYGNNNFSYWMPNSSNVYIEYPLIIPDGFYTISDLNNFLHSKLKSNGHYYYNSIESTTTKNFQFAGSISGTTLTITSPLTVQLFVGTSLYGYGVITGTTITGQTGPYTYTINNSQTLASSPLYVSQTSETSPQIIYPLSFFINTSLYGSTIESYTLYNNLYIQNYLGSGFVYASGLDGQASWLNGYPTAGNLCAYITFPLTNSTSQTLGNILGFSSLGGSLSPYPSVYSSLSASTLINYASSNSFSASPSFSPSGSIVNGIVARCNLINNSVCMPSDIICCMPITSNYGSNLIYSPNIDNKLKLKTGKYDSLTITFNDQDFNNLVMKDNNILVSLILDLK